ncbi:hypothetical protein AVEN_48893-1 [Araneus ventricosus]|uniref:Uncharacterized protein n=1 Tax=Araneus ventricosus TaxID=182803 RepID=A0A4Y2AGD2_ARAVE|nr:hypothetical protein AVEN_48893-1 [Araneus ventricosus]
MQKHFFPCEAVVLDGYTYALSTKSLERQRRIMLKMSATIDFDKNMVVKAKQANFFRNSENKLRLIQMIMGYFQSEGICVIQADEDFPQQVKRLHSIHFVLNFKSNTGWGIHWTLLNGNGS